MEISPEDRLEDVELLNSLASVHVMFGMLETAISILQLSDWIDRENLKTLRLLANVYFKHDSPELALKTLERIEEMVGADEMERDDFVLKVHALAQTGQSDEARNLMLNRA